MACSCIAATEATRARTGRVLPQIEVGVGGGAGDRVGGIGTRMKERACAVVRKVRVEDVGVAQRHRERQRAAGEPFG